MADGDLPPELRLQIDECSAKAEAVVTRFAAQLESTPAPEIIYHYTNDAGLRGILESGKLFFTDVFNLNDPTEIRHGIKPAIDILAEHARTGPQELKPFSELFSQLLTGGIEEVAHFFVCCFSSNSNDLGQWRAYADNGRGYAIGFKGSQLELGFAKPGGVPIPQHSTFPVTYDDKLLARMSGDIIANIVPLISKPKGMNLKENTLRQYISELAVALAVCVLRTAIFFKHEAYKNEQEYRFLQIHQPGPVDGLKFRSRPYSLIRYREYDWRTATADSLCKIIIGPASDRLLASQFATNCIRAFHPAGNIQISQSDIPYRAA